MFKNWSIVAAGVDVSTQVTKAVLKPTQSIQTLKAAVPGAVMQDVGDPTWTFDLTGVQNNDDPTGLAAVLRAAAVDGVPVECVFVPNLGDATTATFDVRGVYMELGGETDAWNTADVSLPVIGDVSWT
jgi:Phage major tail protein 2.